jgi:thiol-disulfide isomerase/thioredoxin
MSWLKRNLVVLIAGAAALLAGGWLGWARLQPTTPTQVDTLWNTQLSDLAGKPFALSAMKGKPLIVNFWATWCGPCKEEMPDFQKLATSDLGKRIQIVGIGIDNAANMQAFADKIGITYKLLDGGPTSLDLLKTLGNQAGGLPFTLVFDSNGKLVRSHLGKITYDELQDASKRALGM